MVNSRNEEPDFDTDEEGNSDDESSYEDEGSTEEEGDEDESEEGEDVDAGDDSEYDSGEYESEEEGDEEDDDDDAERNMGSSEEYESEEEDDEDDDSEEEDGSEEMSEDYSDEDGDDMDDDAFKDEENGMHKRGMSSGSLMNEETDQNSFWMKCVHSRIAAMGAGAVALFFCCIIFIPLLALALGLGFGLSGRETDTPDPTAGPVSIADVNDVELPLLTIQPSKAPTTFAPTEPPLIPVTTLTSDADTTIYRSGFFTGESFGTKDTMLVQNGPPGDSEIPSAYSLIQFDGIQGIDSDTMSIDAYLNSIDGLTIQFCLNRVGADVDENDENSADEVVDNTGPVTKYSTCLLPSTGVTEIDIETLTSDNATEYTIPDSCVNGEVTVFEFIAGATQICIDVTSLFSGTPDEDVIPDEDVTPDTDVTPALRGRRSLQEDDATNATTASGTASDTTLLFMIDTLDVSDKPGDRFYTKADENGRVPTLTFGGENTCRTVGTFKSHVVRENDSM